MATKSVVTGDRYMSLDGKLFEIKRQLRQEGGYPHDLDRLERVLQNVVEGRFGEVERKSARRPRRQMVVIVDCSAPAWCPDGWTVAPKEEQVASRFTGKLELTPESLALHLDPGQEGHGVMVGTALRTALAGKPVLPANVLDGLLEHPELIPEDWKRKEVFFWGTVYRVSDGRLCVRYLGWDGDRWRWSYRWLGFGWNLQDPSVVRASI